MLSINIDDVMNVLTTVTPYLIGFAVVLVIAIAVMIACRKQGKAKKYMIRSQAGLAILLAFGIVANLIAFGPMSTMLSLLTGGGTITEESTNTATELCTEIAEEGVVLLKNDDSTLPLASGDNINVFGWASTNPIFGGTGSGSSDNSASVGILQSLTDAGISYSRKEDCRGTCSKNVIKDERWFSMQLQPKSCLRYKREEKKCTDTNRLKGCRLPNWRNA